MILDIGIFELQLKATDNARKKGWYVRWNKKSRFLPKNLIPEHEVLSIGDALSLVHSEISEALEAYRDNNKKKCALELADVIIRVAHFAGDTNIDLVEAVQKKLEINRKRPIRHGRKNL